MKALILALSLLPLISVSQTTKAPAAKPSTTDCPDFKNKAQVSKADYFESLRHTKKAQPVGASSEKASLNNPPPAKVKPAPEKKSAVPKFSSSDDKILEAKKPAPETKEVKEEKKIPAKQPQKKDAAVTDSKNKAEKKPAKKKEISDNSGKVRTSKKNTQKCPAF